MRGWTRPIAAFTTVTREETAMSQRSRLFVHTLALALAALALSLALSLIHI